MLLTSVEKEILPIQNQNILLHFVSSALKVFLFVEVISKDLSFLFLKASRSSFLSELIVTIAVQ